MGRPLDDYDRIAIASLVIYVFFLAGAVFLCVKHGFAESSGWRYLILLALARIIGDSLRLATVSDPTNKGLYIGWMTLNGLGLSPLLLMLFGVLGRVFDSVNRQGPVFTRPMYRRLVDILLFIAIIPAIVGGTRSSFSVDASGQSRIDYSSWSEASTAICIVVTALLCLTTFWAFRHQGYVSQGEHRIIVGVIASLPFVIARLVYSCLSVFAGVASGVREYLALLVLTEMVVVLICETLGFTLAKAPPPSKDDQEVQPTSHGPYPPDGWPRKN